MTYIGSRDRRTTARAQRAQCPSALPVVLYRIIQMWVLTQLDSRFGVRMRADAVLDQSLEREIALQ